MNGQLRNALLALILLLTAFFFFFRTDSIEATGQGNTCGCGEGYQQVEKIEEPGPFSRWQPPLIKKVVVKAGSAVQGQSCFSTTQNGKFNNNCYKVINLNESGEKVQVTKVGDGPNCKDISHVLFCKKVQPTPTPTPTPTPAEYCDLDKLDVWPLSGNWNYTGKFRIKNTSHKAMTFDWLLDNWDDDSQDQTGTKTLKPGKTIDLGLGKICSKWQLDLKCPTDPKFDVWGFIVESHQSACVTPTATPACTSTPAPTNTPTPTGTPEPTGTPVSTPTPTPGTGGPTPTPVLTLVPTATPEICEQRTWSCQECQSYGDENRLCFEDKLGYCAENYGCSWENGEGEENGRWVCTDTCQVIPTPTEGPGKNVKFEVTAISCTNTNFDAKVIATENGQPLKGIKVQFEYKNEKIDRTTDDQGIAQAGYSFKGVDQVKARPDGFAEQSARIDDAANCPAPTATPGTGGGEVLGANTQPQGKVLGVNTLAPTGVMEDVLMKFASLLGTAMTMVGSVLYGQKKRSTAR